MYLPERVREVGSIARDPDPLRSGACATIYRMSCRQLLPGARVGAATLLALALLGACSGSGGGSLGKDPLATVVAAMQKAGSGRINGSIDGPKGTKPGTVSGEWSGDMTGSASVRAGFVSRTGTKVPTELRWTAKTLYIKRATVTLPANDTLVIFTRVAKFKPWRKFGLGPGITEALGSAFSPLALLKELQQVKAAPTAHGGETVGNVSTTRLSVRLTSVLGIWTGSTVDVWVDEHHLVRRVRIETPAGGVQYDVTDYGARVDVTAPAPNTITDESELVKIQAAEPFKTVASGTSAGVSWSLQRAAGTQGTTCWRWQASRPLAQQLQAPEAGRCFRPVDPDATPDDQTQFLVYGNGKGSYDALAVVLPRSAKKLVLGFVGGKTQPVPVPVGTPLVWVGPPSPFKAYLGITLANGSLVDCGAGAVTTVDDLTNPTLTGPAETAAWACLPHGDTGS